MPDFLLQLGMAALGTLIVAGLSSGLMTLLNTTLPARFGGFCVGLGWALARYSSVGKWDGGLPPGLAGTMGAGLGLFLFRVLLLRGRRASD